jgi:uncharacterized protein
MKLSARLCAAIVMTSALLGGASPAPSQSSGALPRHGLFGAALVDAPGGVTVSAVVPASAAAAAGLQPNDVVKTLDGAPVATAAQFVAAIRAKAAGSAISVAIVRAGTAQVLTATLGRPPDENDPAVRTLYESVTVDGTLRRTLIDVPTGARGRLPAVLLIGGIGCFSVDVAANPDDGYLRIARDVSKAGFVTMRLEKSGVGDSRGPACHDVDFTTESRSYAVALDALRRDPHVDPAHVYILGHSIGTVIAPRLALERPVAGVIVSEAVGRDWFEYELANLRRQLAIGGDPPDVVDATLQSKERCMHRLLVAHEAEAQIERDDPSCKQRNGIYPVAAAYVQQVAALNIIEPWLRLNVPVLAIYGTSDYVVARDDHRRIVDVVNHVHPGNASLHVVDGMDHNLLLAATPRIFYENTQNRVVAKYNTAFSDAVVGWLCNREHCGPR